MRWWAATGGTRRLGRAAIVLGVLLLPGSAHPGAPTHAARPRVTVVEPGAASVAFRPLYAGRPIDGLAGKSVSIWLSDLRSGSRHAPEAHAWNGYVEVSPVPTGVYRVQLVVRESRSADPDAAKRLLPGDLVGDLAEVALVHDGGSRTVDVPLARIMRLREPEDTRDGVGWTPDAKPRLTSPVRFSWDAVPGARRYQVRVQVRCGQSFAGRAFSTVAAGNLDVTHWTVELPPTTPGEDYHLTVAALGKVATVGTLWVQGPKWYGFDYPFTVEAPATPPVTGWWLMLPRMVGGEADVGAPLRAWCAYAEHDSGEPCAEQLTKFRNSGASGLVGFAFFGARCVPAAEVRRPPRRARIGTSVQRALEQAVGDHGTVGTPAQLGVAMDPPPWLLVVPSVTDGASGRLPVLAVDLAPEDEQPGAEVSVVTARALAGVPEYWRIRPSRRPDADVLDVWTQPNAGQRRYDRFLGIQGARARRLALAALPGVTVDVLAMLPPLCP